MILLRNDRHLRCMICFLRKFCGSFSPIAEKSNIIILIVGDLFSKSPLKKTKKEKER